MKRLVTLLFAALVGIHTFGNSASAAPVNAPVDASDFITVGGYDWAWASPCNAVDPTCGAIDFSYQGMQGWALATTSQIDAAISAAGGILGWVAQFEPGDICASRFFTVYSHCDYNDPKQYNLVYNWSGNTTNPGDAIYNEVFAVRVSAVPIPAAGLLLMGGLGLLAAMKRRNQKSV